jgi:ankyrin repeat protein
MPSRDKLKKSPLFIAIENKFPKTVRVLLEYGCQFKERIAKFETFFLFACFMGNAHVVEELITAGCSVDERNVRCESGLVIAAKCRHFKVSKLLVKYNCKLNDTDCKEGWTALKWASYHGDVGTISILLLSGASLNVDDPSNSTPLMLASMNGHFDCVKILMKNDLETLDAVNEYGWSALMLAANNNQVEVVRFLLDNGANPNTQNHVGETALYMAAKLNLAVIVEILLKFGAKPRLKTSDKSTAMIAAAIRAD